MAPFVCAATPEGCASDYWRISFWPDEDVHLLLPPQSPIILLPLGSFNFVYQSYSLSNLHGQVVTVPGSVPSACSQTGGEGWSVQYVGNANVPLKAT